MKIITTIRARELPTSGNNFEYSRTTSPSGLYGNKVIQYVPLNEPSTTHTDVREQCLANKDVSMLEPSSIDPTFLVDHRKIQKAIELEEANANRSTEEVSEDPTKLPTWINPEFGIDERMAVMPDCEIYQPAVMPDPDFEIDPRMSVTPDDEIYQPTRIHPEYRIPEGITAEEFEVNGGIKLDCSLPIDAHTPHRKYLDTK